MGALTADDLRRTTLQRQFPSIGGRGPDAVLDLYGRLGPIQSQVPRAPFLTASSRLPGVAYETVRELFAGHRLVKTSNLRGTVHTSTRELFGLLDAVARGPRAAMLRNNLDLGTLSAAEVVAEIERFCADDWRPRKDIVDHIHSYLSEHDGSAAHTTLADNLIWGHSGLLRRPRDTAWEKRTDIYHRTARSVLPPVLPELASREPAQALAELILVHLRSYGPATRADLAFFFGVGLGQVDTAVASLGDGVARLSGPDTQTYLDDADPPRGGDPDPGLRLLPEFDGLLVGFAGPNRTRFCGPDELSQIWAKVNGLFAPVVLHDGRLVATWRTLTRGKRTDLEVELLRGQPRIADDLFAGQVAAVETVLDLTITDLRVMSPV
jgi:Winged helix DNA-binding domain